MQITAMELDRWECDLLGARQWVPRELLKPVVKTEFDWGDWPPKGLTDKEAGDEL